MKRSISYKPILIPLQALRFSIIYLWFPDRSLTIGKKIAICLRKSPQLLDIAANFHPIILPGRTKHTNHTRQKACLHTLKISFPIIVQIDKSALGPYGISNCENFRSPVALAAMCAVCARICGNSGFN